MNPATKYVEEFVKGVPRVKVLRVGDVLAELDGSAPQHGVPASESLETVLPLLVSTTDDIAVLDDQNAAIGRIDRSAVTRLIQPQP